VDITEENWNQQLSQFAVKQIKRDGIDYLHMDSTGTKFRCIMPHQIRDIIVHAEDDPGV
jgi:hypothetical protein